jgi:hypothetical protein
MGKNPVRGEKILIGISKAPGRDLSYLEPYGKTQGRDFGLPLQMQKILPVFSHPGDIAS